MNSSLVYLATPYNHADPAVREWRFRAVSKAAGHLMRVRGLKVFSPISHSHPIKIEGNLPGGWAFWGQYDKTFLDVCESLIVLKLRGWDESAGVKAEVEYARAAGMPVGYVEPEEVGITYDDYPACT